MFVLLKSYKDYIPIVSKGEYLVVFTDIVNSRNLLNQYLIDFHKEILKTNITKAYYIKLLGDGILFIRKLSFNDNELSLRCESYTIHRIIKNIAFNLRINIRTVGGIGYLLCLDLNKSLKECFGSIFSTLIEKSKDEKNFGWIGRLR